LWHIGRSKKMQAPASLSHYAISFGSWMADRGSQVVAEAQFLGIWMAAIHFAFSIVLPDDPSRAIRSLMQSIGSMMGAHSRGSIMHKSMVIALLLVFSIVSCQVPGRLSVQYLSSPDSSYEEVLYDGASSNGSQSVVAIDTPDGEFQTQAIATVQTFATYGPTSGDFLTTASQLENVDTFIPATSNSTMSLSMTSLLAFRERPLSDLSPEAQAFLESRSGKPGVAVVVPEHRTIYTFNGDEPSPMASVAKVAIMLTTMNRAVQEGRDLTDWEIQLLGPMITESDNDSTDILWDAIGGGPAVEAYMRSIGIVDIAPNQSYAWGTSRASAKAMALLLAQLAFGDILTRPLREMSIALLNSVTPSQRWGVTAGIASEPPPGTVIGLKDGWYPARYAWWVNSTGMLIPADGRPPYTIAVLSRGQPSMEYGIATIEGVAQPVHDALHHPLVASAN
jgi:hypothetical protein